MKIRKIIITVTATITLVITENIANNFNHPNTVKAFEVGFKKGIPSQFKHSWIGKTTNSSVGYPDGYSANFIIKNGKQYQFVTNYWDQNGQNAENKGNVNNLKLKYNLQVGKRQYLLATKATDRKYLVLVKFTGKKKMKFSFAEVNKQGKLYRTSDNFTMSADTKSAVTADMNGELRNIINNDRNEINN